MGILELPDAAPVGVSIVEYLLLDDNIIEIDLTPNRGDCLSIAGVAREVSAINKVPLAQASCTTVDNSIDDSFSVELKRRSIVRATWGASSRVSIRRHRRRCGCRRNCVVVVCGR